LPGHCRPVRQRVASAARWLLLGEAGTGAEVPGQAQGSPCLTLGVRGVVRNVTARAGRCLCIKMEELAFFRWHRVDSQTFLLSLSCYLLTHVK